MVVFLKIPTCQRYPKGGAKLLNCVLAYYIFILSLQRLQELGVGETQGVDAAEGQDRNGGKVWQQFCCCPSAQVGFVSAIDIGQRWLIDFVISCRCEIGVKPVTLFGFNVSSSQST